MVKKWDQYPNMIHLQLLTLVLVLLTQCTVARSGSNKQANTYYSSVDTLNVVDFGANGTDQAEDSRAFQKAIDEASAYNKVLFIPKGTYLLKDVLIRTNTKILGEGESTNLKKIYAGNFAVGCNFSYDAPKNDRAGSFNVKNISISNVHFHGTSTRDGLSQYKHLLNLNGVENVLIKNCWFSQFDGDGIYIGSDVGVERHNRKVEIRNCIFDGVNKANRNAISVIDGDQIKIMDNSFMNCTDNKMPGAIDFEPDVNSFHVIKNIVVTGNSFTNIGGNVGTISVVIAMSQTELRIPVENINISHNYMNNVANGIALFHRNNATKTSKHHSIEINENLIYGSLGYPLGMYGVGNVTVTKNIFDGFKTNIFVGGLQQTFQCFNILFHQNLIKGNQGDGVGISMRMVEKLISKENRFEDIGMPAKNFGIALLAETKGKTSNVLSAGDVVTGDYTTAFSAINPGHVTDAATNEFIPAPANLKGVKNWFPFKKMKR
jgi:hypothetical protein